MNDEGILSGKVCPYCGRATELVDSEVIYGKSYGMIYLCRPCDAYVGVNKVTGLSLGRLANKELRKAKIEAHKWFDQIARTSLVNKVYNEYIPGVSNRNKAYMWLSRELGIPLDRCHIGMFDVEDCELVDGVVVCKECIEAYEKDGDGILEMVQWIKN